MTKRMLMDATHAEETRVVVLDGTRLEDFDVETATKRHLKGNIYLAKVVRVEPSLQAAFVEYGGNRHGFLAFSEIHPDYYQIPVADRQRLIEMEAEEARREEEEADLEVALHHSAEPIGQSAEPAESGTRPWGDPSANGDARGRDEISTATSNRPEPWALASTPLLIAQERITGVVATDAVDEADKVEPWALAELPPLLARAPKAEPVAAPLEPVAPSLAPVVAETQSSRVADDRPAPSDEDRENDEDGDFDEGESIPESPPPETVGGDSDGGYERGERRLPPRFMRNYKIQEVIRRRQILLVQVVKEERGTKGAALTTYLSLAGRFCVLMPNSPRGGGISRKITSATDRRRLKEIMAELDIPKGMGLIVRTAGAQRPKPEIRRDCEYLLRLWDDIREHTMKSVAPALIYEEASLIKRAIRDVYSRDIDEILVDGEDGWHAAHEFMRMLMPSHAKKVQLWRDGGQPLFARYQVEAQLDGMLLPIVQLRSGGYLVINQAEALVAIDVNSGRSTRERNVEETALRTNLEAADEVARQLRLRDLAGLIVIDFIDMESKRHNAMVERRLKDALKNDRARIQVGHISHFGLLEMSRQRLRPSLAETSFIPCPHCGGTGHVRSTESAAIHVLRGIEDEGSKRRAAEIVVHVSTPIALYILNHKRERLREIELRYAMRIIIAADEAQTTSQFRIDRLRPQIIGEAPTVITPDVSIPVPLPYAEVEAEEEAIEEGEDEDEAESEDQGEPVRAEADETAAETERRRRRRRRRRGSKRDEGATEPMGEPAIAVSGTTAEVVVAGPEESAEMVEVAPEEAHVEGVPEHVEGVSEHVEGVPEHAEPAAEYEPATESEEEARNRRRGRRGGRRRRRDSDGELSPLGLPGADQPELLPTYSGPTPADPFGGQAFDIFDVMEQVELSAAAARQTTVLARATEFDSASEIVNSSAPEPVPEGLATEAHPAQPPSVILTPGADEPLPLHGAVSAASPEAEPPAEPADGRSRSETPSATSDAAPEPEVTELVAQPAPDRINAIVNAAAGEPGPAELGSKPQLDAFSAAAVEPAGLEPGGAAEAEQTDAIVNAMAPEPGGADAMHVETTEEATPPVAANDSTPEPLVKPIIIGAGGEPPVEKKRGWWRR